MWDVIVSIAGSNGLPLSTYPSLDASVILVVATIMINTACPIEEDSWH